VTINARKQALPVFTVVVVLVGVDVVLQLWLLSASLEGVLTGKGGVAIPATAASAVLFAANGWLLAYVLGVDRRVHTMDMRRDDR
jgi:hypothetical protein